MLRSLIGTRGCVIFQEKPHDMNYATAISQFGMLIEDIEKTKEQPMLGIAGHDTENLHRRCEVLLNHYYKTTGDPWERSPFFDQLNSLINNEESYNEFNQLLRLKNLSERILLDLKLKRQESDKEREPTKQKIRALESELEQKDKEEDGYKKQIDRFHEEIAELQAKVKRYESKKLFQEIDSINLTKLQIIDANEVVIKKLKRNLWVATFTIVSLINISIAFVLQKFNWIATGSVQVAIVSVFLWMYYKPTLTLQKNIKQHLIAIIVSVISTVIGGFILYKLGLTK